MSRRLISFYIRDEEKMMNVMNAMELRTVSGGENGGAAIGRALGEAAASRTLGGYFNRRLYGDLGALMGSQIGGTSGVATGGGVGSGGGRTASGGGDRGTRGGF
jgi:hypothetical protein